MQTPEDIITKMLYTTKRDPEPLEYVPNVNRLHIQKLFRALLQNLVGYFSTKVAAKVGHA